jgi:hypothetical protein
MTKTHTKKDKDEAEAQLCARLRGVLLDLRGSANYAAARYCQTLPVDFTWNTPPSSAWRK